MPWRRKDPQPPRRGRVPFDISQIPPASGPRADPPPAAPASRGPASAPHPQAPAPPAPEARPASRPPARLPSRRSPGRKPLVATPIQVAAQSGGAPAESDGAPPITATDDPAIMARFERNAIPAAFAFVGATYETGLVTDTSYPAGCRWRRDPADGSVWVAATGSAVAGQTGAELAVALGGAVFEVRHGRAVRLAGHSPAPQAEVATLEPVSLPGLVSMTMPTGRPAGQLAEVAVVTTGRLASVIARQWQRRAAIVTIVPLQRQPLNAAPGEGIQEAVVVRIRSRRAELPAPAVAALTDLPRTVVCRVAERLLIDVRFALPIDDRQLTAEIPADESWIVGGAYTGSWRIIGYGREITPSPELALVVPPEAAPAHLAGPAQGPGQVAEPAFGTLASHYQIPVQLVPASQPDGRADAVLVDDRDLSRLRRFLSRSPLTETAFLFLGPGRHLLSEPSGLLTAVPFGVPVHRIGPGGLYVEAGYVVDPPVPSVARPGLFHLDNESIVVLCVDGAYRLALSAMVPAWSLWLSESPEPTDGLSEYGQRLLTRLKTLGDQTAANAGGAHVTGPTQANLDRARLLAEAEQLEQRGNLPEAARRLEESGELYRAALLYERAARESIPESR